MKLYDPNDRCEEPGDDDFPVSAIELGFAIPVYITSEMQGKIQQLVSWIVDCPLNQPKEGVHWPSYTGGRLSLSAVDAAFLGQPHKLDPSIPDGAEPECDNDVFVIESAARGFVSTSERARIGERRSKWKTAQ